MKKKRISDFKKGFKIGFNMFKDKILTQDERLGLKQGNASLIFGKILGLILSVICFKFIYDILISIITMLFGGKK